MKLHYADEMYSVILMFCTGWYLWTDGQWQVFTNSQSVPND